MAKKMAVHGTLKPGSVSQDQKLDYRTSYSEWSRKELQALAKQYGIAANQTSDVIQSDEVLREREFDRRDHSDTKKKSYGNSMGVDERTWREVYSRLCEKLLRGCNRGRAYCTRLQCSSP